MTKESSNLALKVIENEIKFLYRLLEDKDARIKELEKQIQKEREKNTFRFTGLQDDVMLLKCNNEEKTTKYVGYNTL